MQYNETDTMKVAAYLSYLTNKMGLKNDAALARALGVQSPVVSNLRHGRLVFGPTLIIKTHELTGDSIKVIRAMLPEA